MNLGSLSTIVRGWFQWDNFLIKKFDQNKFLLMVKNQSP
jgi:hypothetical protein